MTENYTKLFGTDGIRGRANSYPMTADIALKVAMAAALALRNAPGRAPTSRVVIGKDTRLSGYLFEEAMGAGFVSMGMEVIFVGPIPTPGIAMLTRSLRADLGVMISASHNAFQDNGIKLFGPDGYKLDDALEAAIEAAAMGDMSASLALPADIGKATRLEDAPGRYVEAVKAGFPKGRTLQGMKIVIDCAHGAAYKVAPQVLWELEAEIIAIGVQPNGRNINDGYGATSPQHLQKAVIEHRADIGLALDGDADRLIAVDEAGAMIDGDQILAALAVSIQKNGTLAHNTVAATVMSNLGMEKFLAAQGIKLLRTKVGDRYVVEAMRAGGLSLGGEQSGHIIMADTGTTGDGLSAALQVLKLMQDSGKPASQCLRPFVPMPQILKNVKITAGAKPMEDNAVQNAIAAAEKSLSGKGRLLVRPSGTEPLIRVMAEGEREADVQTAVDSVCAALSAAHAA